MLIAVLVVQFVVLVAVCALLLRKSAGSGPDPRLAQLADQLTRLDARAEALDGHVRVTLDSMRRDLTTEAQATRESNDTAFAGLRSEVAASIGNLGATLHIGLDSFRADNKTSSEALRGAVQQNLDTIAQRLTSFIAEANRNHLDARDALNARLVELATGNAQHQDKLRVSVEERLTKLNETNAAKLEEMRATVDEKLHATLQSRLTESFGAVSDQLMKVHTGLGEMTSLTSGVNDLNRIFSNVKSRGNVGEYVLSTHLEDMLAPSQFIKNATVKTGTKEAVDFAVRFPGEHGETLLPIDAKFPREDWERLQAAYEMNDKKAVDSAGKALESAIRTQAKSICDKYINPPRTTRHAIMFFPSEGLYAEVARRTALQTEIQSKYQVIIAGPNTLSAMLTSFQMVFSMLNLQKKGDEVWKALETAKTEFRNFGGLMGKVEEQVGTVQKTLRTIGNRTTRINQTLDELSDPATMASLPFLVDDLPGIAPLLAAGGEED